MSRFVLAGAGPGLLSKESIGLMRRYETIGVNTTVKYPEIRPLLNHWIPCDGRMVTPGNDHYIGDFIADGEFDKYAQTDISGPIIAAMKSFESPTKVSILGGRKGDSGSI